jgi:hypothetical protein
LEDVREIRRLDLGGSDNVLNSIDEESSLFDFNLKHLF